MKILKKLLIPIIGLLFLVGCPSENLRTPDPTGVSHAVIKVYGEQTKEDIDKAYPYTDRKGKIYLDDGKEKLDKQSKEIVNASKSHDQVLKENEDIKDQRDKAIEKYNLLYNSWYCKTYRFIRNIFWIWLIIHVGSGILGLIIQGPIGSIFAAIGIISNPLSWFQSARDNAWFRFLAPKK